MDDVSVVCCQVEVSASG